MLILAEFADWAWGLAVIVGPIILGLAIGYGLWRSLRRRRDLATERRGEAATRELYEQEERERRKASGEHR